MTRTTAGHDNRCKVVDILNLVMTTMPIRYVSPEEDSARWNDFPFRDGDIVISTRSKSGTTWLQMICALLIFKRPDLPVPLAELSPWLDMKITPREDIVAMLEGQRHRRFIKTHTPLDGIPLDPRATYIVAARHPLDMAVSLYHQGANIDRERLRRLTSAAPPDMADEPRPPLHEWLVRWIEHDSPPQEELDSLNGVMWHLADAWSRRERPEIVLVHYKDLVDDLAGEMQRLAQQLRIEVPDALWPELVSAATFSQMRARADQLAPNAGGILKDTQAFFRKGVSGDGRRLLNERELARYQARVGALGPLDLLSWLHRC